MKYLIADIFDFFDKLVRVLFYMGASSYLAIKALKRNPSKVVGNELVS